jgi:ABC-type glycerol-3-phosphate transport system substrate-binding protein
MLKDYSTSRIFKDGNPSFETGAAGVSFSLGSWLTVQHEKRFSLASEDFTVIPYLEGNRKICNLELSGLMTFVPPDITPDEKNRVWEFLKILVSREFQIRLAGISGMVSVRKDIRPEDHPWNRRSDYGAFFPSADDIIIYNNIFNMRVIAALSALCEQFEDYDADISHIVRDMDEKVRSIHEPT